MLLNECEIICWEIVKFLAKFQPMVQWFHIFFVKKYADMNDCITRTGKQLVAVHYLGLSVLDDVDIISFSFKKKRRSR